MKPNANLDELLSSFMDGQLSPRQQTEVQRMTTHDPQVARRLRQLQNCRTLFSSLPAAKAPSDLLEQIKTSLERHSLLQEPPSVKGRTFGAVQLAFRRLVSVAAVIALVGVLGVVVYQIVSPIPDGGVGSRMANKLTPVQPSPLTATPIMVADDGFTGRLELRTAKLAQVDTFLGRSIENNGLSSRVESTVSGNQRVYRITGTRESVNRLVASLSGVWQNYFDSATMQVDRSEASVAPVLVEAITPEQTATIVAQNSTNASIQTAANYAIMNHMAKSMPGNEIRPLIQRDPGSLLAAASSLQSTVETGPVNANATRTTPAPSQEKAQVNLTIVLLNVTYRASTSESNLQSSRPPRLPGVDLKSVHRRRQRNARNPGLLPDRR